MHRDTASSITTPSSAVLRGRVARALTAVVGENRTIDWLLDNRSQWLTPPLAQELLYGTLRHYYSLSSQVRALLNKPLRGKDQDINHLMLVGAYQLTRLAHADYAVVNETVAACKSLQKPWAKGLVNAVLRQLIRSTDYVPSTPEQSFDHPQWLVSLIQRQYPSNSATLMHANNERAPMWLRINRSRVSRTDYLVQLQQQGINIDANGDTGIDAAIKLTNPISTLTLPAWQQGYIASQDLGAQFAQLLSSQALAGVLNPRILDACSAPGGKLFHLLEHLQSKHAKFTALEISPRRLKHLSAEASRLGHADEANLDIQQGDATTLDWWQGEPFQHIMIDAPCSGTGTLRRHPDIKLLLNPDAIVPHTNTQLELLHNLWTTLAPGGSVLYSTCSLLQQENDAVIDSFMGRHDDAVLVPFSLPSGKATQHGWQLTPLDVNTDGFYYCLLRREQQT